jgi:hypothetical protein
MKYFEDLIWEDFIGTWIPEENSLMRALKMNHATLETAYAATKTHPLKLRDGSKVYLTEK